MILYSVQPEDRWVVNIQIPREERPALACKQLFQSTSKTWPGDKCVYLNRISPRNTDSGNMIMDVQIGIPKKM